jgi:hypothetical protein
LYGRVEKERQNWRIPTEPVVLSVRKFTCQSARIVRYVSVCAGTVRG